MGDFLTSPFIKNLKNGDLPDVDVNIKIDTETLIQIGIMAFVVGTLLYLTSKVINKIA